jgi:adenylate cyclase
MLLCARNFNQNLKYLNLSGNKRLEIKPPSAKHPSDNPGNGCGLADFSGLTSLRVLGLMDVTTTFLPNIPEENEDRRVRTSLSEVNKMSYGIADNLGNTGYLTMFDLVQPEFRGHKDEAVFAMFGRSDVGQSNNHLSKYLHDNFLPLFSVHLGQIDQSKSETVRDALRRTFLRLNKQLHDTLYAGNSSNRKMSQVSASTAGTTSFERSYRAGASGIVLYFVGKTMYVANAGDALAVVSIQGSAELFARKHEPFDRREAERIRTAEGWISPNGLVHEEIDASRSFGYFYHFPVVNARPYVEERQLTEQDEFVIVGNRGLWDYISYQTAVDIARSEISDPMIAAQKLRDFAISYGSDGSTMIMVICLADLFRPKKEPTTDSSMDVEAYSTSKKRGGKKADIQDRTIARLDDEVSPPTGHLCLVFTDIRNSTQLWEANKGMKTAMRLHNSLLRRQLRICGGYVVKTEGDAFMCSFPTTLAALWWSLTVQIQLMHEPWPLEILECEEGKEMWDAQGNLVARGLSVRMGIHCGAPVCEPDPITDRMDYFGPMVIRAARISGNAAGGQIMCSADVIREINARITETGPDTEYSEFQPPQAIEAIRRMNIKVIPVGEFKLKGLEIPEMVSSIYPGCIAGRQDIDLTGGSASALALGPAKVQWSIGQVRALAVLCLRFEALASARVFRPYPRRKDSIPPGSELLEDDRFEPCYMYGDPDQLLPAVHDKMGELEIMMVLDSLLTRLENAASAMTMTVMLESMEAMQTRGSDERTLGLLSSLVLR